MPKSLTLVPITAALAATPEIAASELLQGVCQGMLPLYPDGQPVMPWAGYLAQEDRAYVGTCAFKTTPQDDAVEIAYFTFPGQEGRGVATAMAQALLQIAAEGSVRVVRAQTLPEKNASTAILTKLGFVHAGTVQHPEDGPVWEWHKAT